VPTVLCRVPMTHGKATVSGSDLAIFTKKEIENIHTHTHVTLA
jgi:hypothetical protein